MIESSSRFGEPKKTTADFFRQMLTLIGKSYPRLARIKEKEFILLLHPLIEVLEKLEPMSLAEAEGNIPYVVVIKSELLATERMIEQVSLDGKPGFTTMKADDLKRFRPIDGLTIPESSAYLMFDVATGKDLLNVTPDDALKVIQSRGRSPLTIDEGLALATHFPDLLRTKNCFSLLGSRCGDKRVTAIWISAKMPKLGWCWAGNPHTWLGSASCAARVGV